MKKFKNIISIVLVLSMLFSSMAVFAGATFSDVAAGTATETAVTALADKGILSGYPDGTFKPDGAITRAEFAAVITRFKGIANPTDRQTGFADLDADTDNAWARGYVKTAVDAGIIEGYEDGTFRANESVTYEQAVKMLVCALDLQAEADEALASLENASWSAGYIAVAEQKGITKNAESSDVTSPASRGTIAILTHNARSVLIAQNKLSIEARRKAVNEKKELRVLAFGNSYSSDSLTYLAQIGAADGISVYAVNMNSGSCSFAGHNMRMNGEATYTAKWEFLPDGTTNTIEKAPFDAAFETDGKAWDYVTLHQKSYDSPFFDTYYTEETPYLTMLANYIRAKSPESELLLFGSWSAHTKVIADKYEDVYKPLVEGLSKDEYYGAVHSAIKTNYQKAAEIIGNPNRIIPAGEAAYLAVTQYGFADIIMDGEEYIKDGRSIYRDASSHLNYNHGRVLAGLTWYEYLTGNDVRNNPYTHESISAEDMALLKEIAHYVCSLPEYNPAN